MKIGYMVLFAILSIIFGIIAGIVTKSLLVTIIFPLLLIGTVLIFSILRNLDIKEEDTPQDTTN